MKKTICVVAGLMISASTVLAATKTLRRTIDETQLQGYVATPPAGWAQNKFTYGAATPIGSASPAVYAISNQIVLRTPSTPSIPLPTVPPPPVGVTLISLSRSSAMIKENLPDAVQITASDCILSYNEAHNLCPNLYTLARPAAALPGGLLFMMLKPVRRGTSFVSKYFLYVFDPSADGVARWLYIESGIADSSMIQMFVDEYETYSSNDVGKHEEIKLPGQTFQVADPNWYLFERQSPTIMKVYQIAPK
ncbi:MULTISPECIES: hypothetical protein [Methylosinus]|uniref:Uncharacterized protein n=1 Tax=Methylosinus trichosporium (strain ATCC 35070 / NCIMB 11131 / UNIQEM 75 / OB3b) TaxID=595536 RepID=A0A2D2CX06_METT3|nr:MULTISPECIES: hypothetical protein [Methylosinus]ATQ67292.1 hypothetical protein CQW49_04830 [Methylosinus trichosporium OB3b]OBS52086.1 hypothetical protein A8B73_13000 [Methylosinus sp. 3S-1]